MARLTNKQIAHALTQQAGNIAQAAAALGVSRSTLYRHMDGNDELNAIVTDAREKMVDVAESALYREILKGNTAAIIFALKTQGKERGYVERVEIEHRYKVILERIEEAAKRAGIDPAEALNDYYAELASIGAAGGAADAQQG